MKTMTLFFGLTFVACGQVNPVIRVFTYAGAPTGTDCDSVAEEGTRIAFNTSGATSLIYDCAKVSSTVQWVQRTSGGTVTSVSWTGGIVSVANPTTTPAFTIAGNSGGIPYFDSGTSWASSTAGTSGHLVTWGGAGNQPTATDPATFQAVDADLSQIAGLTRARGTIIRGDASAWGALALGSVGGLLYSDGTDVIWLARISATGAINFGSINDGACAESTFTLTGSALGDAVAFGSATALPAGIKGTARISAADTAEIQLCNLTGSAYDPASITFTARVVR